MGHRRQYYIGDGYFNSRIAKFDKNGNWIKQWGGPGEGGAHANENPGKFRNPHNVGIDRNGNLYVADRGNRRIHVFDTDGNFKEFIFFKCDLRQDATSRSWRHAC
jgi:DNA-binding beta-propeller fold protein YncE